MDYGKFEGMNIRKWFLVLAFSFGTVHVGMTQMRNQRLFKVDPAGLLFHELRVAVEQRLFKDKDYFWYLAPYGTHQSWLARDHERYDRPTFPQKYYGIGLRAGARRYFIPKGTSPEGFFFQAMISGRQTWVNNYNDDLQFVSRGSYTSLGLGAVVGYQKLYGPGFVPRKNFAYGIIGGLEYERHIFPANGVLSKDMLVRNWYQFPFFPHFLHGFRVYLGVEVGFAFLQKRLHW